MVINRLPKWQAERSAAAIRYLYIESIERDGIAVVMYTSGGFAPAAFDTCPVRLLLTDETPVCGRLHLIPSDDPRGTKFSYRFAPSRGQRSELFRFFPGENPWSNVATIELIIQGRAVRKKNTYDNSKRA